MLTIDTKKQSPANLNAVLEHKETPKFGKRL